MGSSSPPSPSPAPPETPWDREGGIQPETGQKRLPDPQHAPPPAPRAPYHTLTTPPSPSFPPALTSLAPGSRERPVPDSPIAGSRPQLSAQPSGLAAPYVLQL